MTSKQWWTRPSGASEVNTPRRRGIGGQTAGTPRWTLLVLVSLARRRISRASTSILASPLKSTSILASLSKKFSGCRSLWGGQLTNQISSLFSGKTKKAPKGNQITITVFWDLFSAVSSFPSCKFWFMHFIQGSLQKSRRGSINQRSTNQGRSLTAKEQRRVDQRSSNSTEDGTLVEERRTEEFGKEENVSVADALQQRGKSGEVRRRKGQGLLICGKAWCDVGEKYFDPFHHFGNHLYSWQKHLEIVPYSGPFVGVHDMAS